MKNILLSADGDISLYLVKEELLEIIDELVKEFDNSNNTNCFDEKSFVKFLCEKYGNECISLLKLLVNVMLAIIMEKQIILMI